MFLNQRFFEKGTQRGIKFHTTSSLHLTTSAEDNAPVTKSHLAREYFVFF